MKHIPQLKKRIEDEREKLDEIVLEESNVEECCAQSRKIDELIERYYLLAEGCAKEVPGE